MEFIKKMKILGYKPIVCSEGAYSKVYSVGYVYLMEYSWFA